MLLYDRIKCGYGSIWTSFTNIHVLSGIRTHNHSTQGPPGPTLTVMADEVSVLGMQHGALVMELDPALNRLQGLKHTPIQCYQHHGRK
jgi:hypothetical protein